MPNRQRSGRPLPEGRPCGQVDCPIVEPSTIDRRSLRLTSLEQDAVLHRVASTRFADNVFTPEGIGNGRFSPVEGRSHTYVAQQRSAALLESALHEAAGPNPRIYRTQLAALELITLQFATEVPVVDLRDAALLEIGLSRDELTGATPRHYQCTRQVAEYLVGTKGTAGMIWTSRQGVLHAERNPDGLASEVLRHESLDVAAVYRPDFKGPVDILDRTPLVADGTLSRFVLELANLLRIAVL